MTAPTNPHVAEALNDLLGVVRSNWRWPSPETGFARHVFTSAGEAVPVAQDDGGSWPDARRLDEAPILAAAGYMLSMRPHGVLPSQHQEWSDGITVLQGRNAFPSSHDSFAHRPIEVLGLALGLSTCRAVERPQVEWMRGIIARLR